MSKKKDDKHTKDRDDESFLYAFDYFFHANCDESTDFVCDKVTRHLHDNPRYARIKANIINTPDLVPPKRRIYLSDTSQEFVDSLGSEVSKESIQLSTLFESLQIQGLFSAYDHILKYMNDSEFPQSSQCHECNCYLSGSRKIKIIVPKDGYLGLTVDIDGVSGQAFVAKIDESGAAYKSGCIKERDFLLEINEINTKFKSVDELEDLLVQNPNGFVSLTVESCADYEEKSYYLRSMNNFSVNSVSNAGYIYGDEVLNVNKGDLFEISGSINNEWLKARFLGNTTLLSDQFYDNENSVVGLIPIEIKPYKADTSENVNNNNSNNNGMEMSMVSSYERLSLIEPSSDIVRCVLLVGPGNVGRNALKKALLTSFPNNYANVVPHTTRKPRKNEENGVHYNFVEFQEMEKFIFEGECVEHGEYNNNLYGTTYGSIIDVMRQGKWPILNVNPKSIVKLRNATFKPIIIFVKPPDILTLKQTRSKPLPTASSALTLSSYFSDLDFKEMIAAAGNIQRNYGEFFDVSLVNGAFDSTFAELCGILFNFENNPNFMPQKWVDWI